MVICLTCKVSKKSEDFYCHPKTGYREKHCRDCRKEARLQWRRDNLVRSEQVRVLSRYGLTPEEVEDLFEDFGYMCGICGCKGRLVIDHCHKTNKVRGVLCHRCNVSIGALGDSVEGLEKAISYLKAGW